MKRLLGFCVFVLVLWGSAAYGASVMYGVASDNQFFEIDPSTAVTAYVSTLHVVGGSFGGPTTLAFAPDGTLYTYSSATRQFGVVDDPLTGEVSLLPVGTGSIWITAVSFTNDGTMWAVDYYQRRLWTVDPTTGQLLTSYGYNLQYSGLAAYDDGVFYLGQYSGNMLWMLDLNTMVEVSVGNLFHGSPVRDLCRMDDGVTAQTVGAVTTGYALEYADINPFYSYMVGYYSPYLQGVAYRAYQQEIPEPTCLVLVVAGVLAAGITRLRRR